MTCSLQRPHVIIPLPFVISISLCKSLILGYLSYLYSSWWSSTNVMHVYSSQQVRFGLGYNVMHVHRIASPLVDYVLLQLGYMFMWFTAQKLSSHQPMGTVVSKAHRSFTIASSFVQIYKLSMSALLWLTLDWPVFNSMRSCSILRTRTPYLVGSNFICSQFHRYFCLIKTYFDRHAATVFLLNTKQSRGTRLPFMVVIRHTIHQSWNKLAILPFVLPDKLPVRT